jgi:NADPH:quinone reductase-like Zn-dependent oxidoreductase
MRAFAADRFGDLGELRIQEVARPVAAADELLIEVRAAAINPADLKVLEHRDGGSFLHAATFPLLLGYDFSGVVVARGAAVAGPAVGDEVYGFLPYARSNRSGSFAEYLAVAATSVGPKPAALSHAEAAAAATCAVTALQALRDKGRLRAGQAVLINGASGGVGSYAVQIAKRLGATVTATASAARLAYVEGLGADRVVDYRTTAIADLAARFDLVLDVAATSSFAACAPRLTSSGGYVSLLPSAGLVLGMARALFSSRRCGWVVVEAAAADLAQLARWFDDGTLKPIVDSIYPFAELPAALAKQRAGGVQGKIAITIERGADATTPPAR